jgi:hypothetical protein
MEEIARLKSQLSEASKAVPGVNAVKTSPESEQLQETIEELSVEKTNVRYISCSCYHHG